MHINKRPAKQNHNPWQRTKSKNRFPAVQDSLTNDDIMCLKRTTFLCLTQNSGGSSYGLEVPSQTGRMAGNNGRFYLSN